jgi:hypothetical protein
MTQLKHLKLLGLALLAITALASITAATAQAEELPNILPCGTEALPVLATATSGKSNFGSGTTAVTSASSLGTQSGTSCKLGTFHTSFLKSETKTGGVVCTGLGDEPGVILVLGEYHIRHAELGSKLYVVSIFLLEDVHFACGMLLVLVGGCVAGTVLPESTLTKELTIGLNVIGTDNEILTVLKEIPGGTSENCYLLAQVNEGASALSSQEQLVKVTGFKQNGAAVEVLVMPL